MSIPKGKGPLVDPGTCRCCGATKKCRLLTAEYEFEGVKEKYSDMFMDCFGILLPYLDGKLSEKLICATCVVRLREAKHFKKQVLESQQAFLRIKNCENDPQEIGVSIKVEMDDVGDADSMGRNSPYSVMENNTVKAEDSGSNDDEPLVNLKRKERTKSNSKKLKVKKKDGNTDKGGGDSVAKPKLHPLVRQQLLKRQSALNKIRKLKALERYKLLLKVQQDSETDKSSIIHHNVSTIIENSYVCPFRCRHNLLYCYYCKKQFSDPNELREHTSTHNVKSFTIVEYRTSIKLDITNINCRLCPETIDNLDAFKEHICTAHDKTFYKDVPDFLLQFRLNAGPTNCVHCDKEFLYFHALNQHMNEHFNNYVCETCGIGFVDQSRMLAHQSKHEAGTYPCAECGKEFRNEMYRDLHVDRVHKKLGKVYCPKCDVRLMSFMQKQKHLVEVHGEKLPQLSCTLCDKVFEYRRYLTIHLRKDHIKDFRYECEYCGQKFFTRFALKNHMPTHTGERNFKCKICEKSYPRLKTLKEHMRIHTNDRRYRCHICGQAFIQNCSLKGHMRSQHPEYA